MKIKVSKLDGTTHKRIRPHIRVCLDRHTDLYAPSLLGPTSNDIWCRRSALCGTRPSTPTMVEKLARYVPLSVIQILPGRTS